LEEERQPGILDRAVELLAHVMDSLGLNGRRLRWKWERRRIKLREAGVRGQVMMRSAKAKHKMCRECRSLVERSASECPECGASMAGVSVPGPGRLLSNLFPGITAATSLIMLVNGFWFVIMMMAQIKSGSGGLGFDGEFLVRFGSGLSRAVALSDGQIAGGEWWRWVTPIFLHGGLIHFGFNSYVLLQLGPIVEEIYGTERYWVIYLSCGISGSLVSQVPRFVNTVGASGAIMGLMGLLLVYGWRRGGAFGESLKSSMIRFGVYILIFSLLMGQGIDHFNHAGGFACGAVMALVVPPTTVRDRGAGALWSVLSVAGVILVMISFYKVAMAAR